MSTLFPCPKCGHVVSLASLPHYGLGSWAVVCVGCGWHGPIVTPEEVLDAQERERQRNHRAGAGNNPGPNRNLAITAAGRAYLRNRERERRIVTYRD